MSFGSFIRQHREQAGVQLKHLAASIEISPAHWSRIERGMEKPPKDALILAAAEKLGLSSDDAFVAAGRLPPDIQTDIRTVVLQYRKLKTCPN